MTGQLQGTQQCVEWVKVILREVWSRGKGQPTLIKIDWWKGRLGGKTLSVDLEEPSLRKRKGSPVSVMGLIPSPWKMEAGGSEYLSGDGILNTEV